MKLVLTNDDGIDAPGLATLARAAAAVGETIVVAPRREWSGVSHRVTTHGSLAIERRAPDVYAIDGTPADCVRLAVERIAPGADLVLAGLNHGGNLGVDVYYSGTVAAAREAAIHGFGAIALSHYLRRGLALDLERAEHWLRALLPELLAAARAPGEFFNVNLPHLDPGSAEPAWELCPVDPSPLPLGYHGVDRDLSYRGDYHARARRPDHDVDVCFGGRIAVSRIAV